jgi:3-ketosteroid 9alpha-monooxygenase subunit B
MAILERKKPVEYEATVVELRMETADTATLLLDLGPGPLDYKAGQYLNIDPRQFPALAQLLAFLEDKKGRREPLRSYSLASAPHERYVAITVKDEPYLPGVSLYPPLLSPFLVHGGLVGRTLRVTGFMGPYILPPDVDERTPEVLHVIAGSGAVPNFALIKDALHRGLKVRHTLLMANKTWADVLFREELHALERAHPERLRIVHTLTREPDGYTYNERVRQGRISKELLGELLPVDPVARENLLVYACGPAITPWDRRKALETRTTATPRFMETVIAHLHELGVGEKRIKRETYG